MKWLVAVAVLAGCSRVTSTGDGTPGDATEWTVRVTVARHPAVHEVASIAITRTAGGISAVETIQITDAEFPVTYEFEVDSPQTATIEIVARNTGQTLVGTAKTTADPFDDNKDVMLQGADFVVNTVYPGAQFLTNDFEAVGLQLASLPAFDTYMLGFRQECSSCNIHGRRFDGKGYPLVTGFAGDANQFELNAVATTSSAIPALAATSDRILAFWDFTDTTGTGAGIACRSVDIVGSASTPVTIAAEQADVVTASPIPLSDDVVVTWQSFMTTQVVRSMIVDHNCTPLTTPTTVSIVAGTTGGRRSHAASTGNVVLYAWIVDGNVHLRTSTINGSFVTGDTRVIYSTLDHDASYVRVVRWRDEFALAVRWGASTGVQPGKLEVYGVSLAGTLSTESVLIDDQLGSDFASNKAFGLAARDDDTLLVVWHTCPQGTGSCDVFGRTVTATRSVGPGPIALATTTENDQSNPSAAAFGDDFMVAWNDASGTQPDNSGLAVRARIIRPDP